jgi:hypothetical protein
LRPGARRLIWFVGLYLASLVIFAVALLALRAVIG